MRRTLAVVAIAVLGAFAVSAAAPAVGVIDVGPAARRGAEARRGRGQQRIEGRRQPRRPDLRHRRPGPHRPGRGVRPAGLHPALDRDGGDRGDRRPVRGPVHPRSEVGRGHVQGRLRQRLWLGIAMSDRRQGVAVRSYRDVVDVVERRIFRIDRWRLPTPHGVPVRAIGYALAILGLVLARRRPAGDRARCSRPCRRRCATSPLPAIGGWALQAATLDGRPPHHVLFAATRHRLGARTLAGLRPAPAVGSRARAGRARSRSPRRR